MTLGDVKRNDLKAAAAYYKARGEAISQDEYMVLYRLQDDPKDFVATSRDWKVGGE